MKSKLSSIDGKFNLQESSKTLCLNNSSSWKTIKLLNIRLYLFVKEDNSLQKLSYYLHLDIKDEMSKKKWKNTQKN